MSKSPMPVPEQAALQLSMSRSQSRSHAFDVVVDVLSQGALVLERLLLLVYFPDPSGANFELGEVHVIVDVERDRVSHMLHGGTSPEWTSPTLSPAGRRLGNVIEARVRWRENGSDRTRETSVIAKIC